LIQKMILSLLASACCSSALAAMPALKYKTADCTLMNDSKVVKQQSVAMMFLQIDSGFGRFAELQLGDDKLPIQYQIFIEDDLSNQATDHVLILQNLKVGDVESSSEFSGRDVKWLRIAQGAFSVRCELK